MGRHVGTLDSITSRFYSTLKCSKYVWGCLYLNFEVRLKEFRRWQHLSRQESRSNISRFEFIRKSLHRNLTLYVKKKTWSCYFRTTWVHIRENWGVAPMITTRDKCIVSDKNRIVQPYLTSILNSTYFITKFGVSLNTKKPLKPTANKLIAPVVKRET
jgi:hypothetical protein